MSRLHRQAMRVLVSEIVSGALLPGTLLPGELEIVQQFDISRGVARESIRGLEERGLISVKHGMGATVLPQDKWNIFDSEVIAAQLASGKGAQMLGEFLECRRVLEVAGAGFAAERASAEDLTTLNAAFDKMTAIADRVARNPVAENLYHEADIAFHQAVIRAAHNRALARMAAPLHSSLLARRALARPDLRLKRSLPEHQRVLDAIASKNIGKARAAMEAHLLTVESYLREYATRTDGHPGLDLSGWGVLSEPDGAAVGERPDHATVQPNVTTQKTPRKHRPQVAQTHPPSSRSARK